MWAAEVGSVPDELHPFVATKRQCSATFTSGVDDADLQEVYDTERHLLYVTCTRARDHLLVTGVEPASEFLDDFSA